MLKAEQMQRGFTLVELLIAVAIVGILLAAALPSFSTWLQNTKVRSAAESIMNGLQLARAEAVKRNTPVQFVLGAGSGWTVCVSATCPTPIQSRSPNEGASTAITVTPTPPAGTTIVFDSFGRATPDTMFNVDLASADRPLRITIGTGGNARMCDPEPTLQSTDPRKCL